jgi:hypothetical protein
VHLQRDDDVFDSYAADGRRLGTTAFGGEHVAFDRRSKQHWTFGEDEDKGLRLRRYGEDGEVNFETERRPDGAFFAQANGVACGPDGSVLVLDANGQLALFNSKGESTRQFPALGEEFELLNNLQLGRRWILAGCWSTAILISRVDGSTFSFTTPDSEQGYGAWLIGLSPDETQLWAYTPAPAVVRRYQLPK